MLVSALLTSVAINSALCVSFFVLYSILRKLPNNFEVYIPRLLVEGNFVRRSLVGLERLIPSTSWLGKAWRLSEEDILLSSGLDGVVYMRTITLLLKVFTFAGIIGIFVLLPVHCSGTELDEFDFTDLYNNSLDEYRYISSKRIDYFYSSKPQPHQFTILVRSIPVSAGSSVSDSVDRFFTEYHPTTYLSHVVIHRTSKLRTLVSQAKKMYRTLKNRRSQSSGKKYKRLGLFGRKYELVDDYGKQLDDIEQNVRMEQSALSLADETRAAFVSFKSRYAAAIASRLLQSVNPTQWLTEQAPEPSDVYWPFFSESFMRRWISKLVVVVARYLPSLILQSFLKTVPPIMEFLSSIQGYISHSEIEKSACNKVSIILDPRNIPANLAVSVPAQFINVYAPKYESAGKFWPIVHNTMIFSLVLMHAIAVGIFTLKKLSLASTLILPLPILTLLFNEYCRKRFLPVFVAYPAEVLITKDRQDRNDTTMSEFYDKLATAYQDPALMPIRYSESSESLSRPLLSSAQG
ncbi:hypothetical protein Tsubulata_047763, partial [Turnera subulata]